MRPAGPRRGRPVPGRESADFESTPQLALLATPGDEAADWLRIRP
ncbi:hypothetical protein [Streptomyces sparsogenes]